MVSHRRFVYLSLLSFILKLSALIENHPILHNPLSTWTLGKIDLIRKYIPNHPNRPGNIAQDFDSRWQLYSGGERRKTSSLFDARAL